MTYQESVAKTNAALVEERAEGSRLIDRVSDLELQVADRDAQLEEAGEQAAKDAATIQQLRDRIAELEGGEQPIYLGPIYGSTSKADTFAELDAKLASAAGLPAGSKVLMFDHKYEGNTIPSSLPSKLATDRSYGMLNVKGSTSNPPVQNLAGLARSLPAGFRLYLPAFHEPEDNMTPAVFWGAFLKVVRAVLAIDPATYKPGAVVIPMLNLHGRLFDGRGPADWGTADSWAPPSSMTQAEKDAVVASINGYSTGDVARYDTPAEVFQPGFDKLTMWGFTRLGVCEFGWYPRTNVGYLEQCEDLFEGNELEVVSYFHSDAGSNSPDGTWALDTQGSLRRYALMALNGKRA